ncbi:hypothetical protein [Maridesulfovibrio sp.]|uniref:hypothetical protein n=1 Tax=Maridesulfovibrio sp. TaxID=2795000 RepID=UPI0029CA1E96|nr:hypothetical protein [Maridesulfovibrio sp.]
MEANRYTAKRSGLDWIIKDNKTGEVVGTFHHNPRIPKLAEKLAKTAAGKFNELVAAKLTYKRRYEQLR